MAELNELFAGISGMNLPVVEKMESGAKTSEFNKEKWEDPKFDKESFFEDFLARATGGRRRVQVLQKGRGDKQEHESLEIVRLFSEAGIAAIDDSPAKQSELALKFINRLLKVQSFSNADKELLQKLKVAFEGIKSYSEEKSDSGELE
ncbi:hypothetical protein LUW74_43810 [Actinomadura madurae]|uniref:hypothetical protein n=1 Tax=Actinomadura madurae TaxID=1993 RepID=UPI0020269DA5|nr:hypothetical protein [Actinomadura madurae]URN09602.1 hypothetical protein LUW74_43810 [Actinomadura madurae]